MSGQSFTLGSSISSTQTTILLSSFKVPVVNTNITMATMGSSIAYGTLAPGTSQAELISFTGVTQNANGTATLTGVTRGLDKEYPYTESTSFKQPHAGQTIFILSDAPQVFNEYPAKRNDETITGKWTFPAGGNANAPVSGNSYTAPTDDLEYAPKKYVDDIAIAGSPDATTTIKGIVEVATQAEVLAKTALGGTGASLSVRPDTLASTLLSDYKADTGAANAYVITPVPAITAYTAGQIFTFKATNANTAASTLNVSGLGAKTIKKGSGSTDLASGDIAAGMIVLCEYDGTNMVMLNPVANAPTTAQVIAFGNGSDGDVTISSNTSLTRDMYYNNLTINNTFTLSPKGYRIFVAGTLTCVGTGKIDSNGGAGGAGANSTAASNAGGTAGAQDYTTGTLPIPKIGVAGTAGTALAAGTGGAGAAATLNLSGQAAAAGGNSGASSQSGSGTGGAAGATGSQPVMRPYVYLAAYNLYDLIVATITRHEISPSAGSGASGAGNNPTTLGGGGGGASGSQGGVIFIAARIISTLNVNANGGAGGVGGNGNTTQSGPGGGGGGGNGGIIILVYSSASGIVSSVTGGTGGAAGTAGSGGATSGGNGNAGVVYQITV